MSYNLNSQKAQHIGMQQAVTVDTHVGSLWSHNRKSSQQSVPIQCVVLHPAANSSSVQALLSGSVATFGKHVSSYVLVGPASAQQSALEDRYEGTVLTSCGSGALA